LENVTYIPKLEMLLDHVRMVGGKARLIYVNGVLKAFE
jgi:hypothetical protein